MNPPTRPPRHRASEPPAPTHRLLRGYAFDPSLATSLQTALVSEITYRVPWEPLCPGPVGPYVEVVDYDPASGCFYAPVDLDHPRILAQNGLPPSEGDPQFHQQMVYAVAMTTIDRFERALGRKAFWAHRPKTGGSGEPQEEYVPRLRLYPHALRMANAYYSRNKASILFGYFPATQDRSAGQFPGGAVFTCLSHDIIAHEVTHALLDGFHPYFMDATNKDVLAFHEAFADIVALFQHFSFPEVLAHQIARTRGDLSGSENLLAQLATQFGHARGIHGALRDAIGGFDEASGRWVRREPDPAELDDATEVHARGAILVAAVFDAFLSIYHTRTRDLVRLASGGTGVLPRGELHPDLVNRLASEASKSAGQVLNICIRALDYCPPVDLTFGEYLRALITADMDLMPEDRHNYRVAFIEAFRRRGIYPDNVRTLSEDSLRWAGPDEDPTRHETADRLQGFIRKIELRKHVDEMRHLRERDEIWEQTRQMRHTLADAIRSHVAKEAVLRQIAGLAVPAPEALAEAKLNLLVDRMPPFQVHALREARRLKEDGRVLDQVFITILQQAAVEHEGREHPVTSGSTLVLNLDEMRVTHVIGKGLRDLERLKNVVEFRQAQAAAALSATYFGPDTEPFAALHRSGA